MNTTPSTRNTFIARPVSPPHSPAPSERGLWLYNMAYHRAALGPAQFSSVVRHSDPQLPSLEGPASQDPMWGETDADAVSSMNPQMFPCSLLWGK